VEPRGLEQLANSDRLSEILQAVSKPAKMQVFLLLYHGLEPSEIQDKVDVSGSTVHNYVNELEDADLVVHSSDGYSLTWQGEYVLAMLENLSTMLKAEHLDSLYEAVYDSPDLDDWSPDLSEDLDTE